MELKIKKRKDKRNRKPHYIFEIEFMEGDAAGMKSDSAVVNADEVDTIHSLILATACCCAAYPNGRAGYDEYDGLLEYDAFFGYPNINYYKYLATKDMVDEDLKNLLSKKVEEINPQGWGIEHPSDSMGISTSFENYYLIYVDENGDESPVEIIFNEAEKARIEECSKFFKR